MKFNQLSHLIAKNQLQGKRVFIRSDLNVPRDSMGNITEDTRIHASLPAICQARDAGAAVMVTSHLGRPLEGDFQQKNSLISVARRMSKLLGEDIPLISNWIDGVNLVPGQIVLLENCRLNKGEKNNSIALSQKMAKLCDIYVNDAFGTAHRVEASTYGIAQFVPVICAGPLLAKELYTLDKVLSQPTRPLIAIVAGSKISSKLKILKTLAYKIDQLIIGGGIANTFMLASNLKIGKSLVEINLVDAAKTIIEVIVQRKGSVLMPVDVVCSKSLLPHAQATIKNVQEIANDDMIFDIGPKTAILFKKYLIKAGTIIWNGPVGVFEFDQFSKGTQALAQTIANSNGFSIAGGGDTLAAIAKYNIMNKIDYISTGGGAFLSCLEGKILPAVEVLIQRAHY